MRKIIAVAIGLLALLSILAFVGASNFADGLVLKAYTDYVSLEYLPAMHHKTGQWPEDLNKMSQHIQEEQRNTQSGYGKDRLQRVLQFHKRSYRGMKIQHFDSESCSYTVYLDKKEVSGSATTNTEQ